MTLERFSRKKTGKILGLSQGKLRYWEKLGLAEPSLEDGKVSYDLTELIRLRAIEKLTRQGAKAKVLATPEMKARMDEKRLEVIGDCLVVFEDGQPFDVVTGQMILEFEKPAPASRPVRLPFTRDWTELARAARERGDYGAAIEALKEAVAHQPREVESYNQLGILLLEAGRAEEAVRVFRQALWLAPRSPSLRFNLANALDETGDHQSARQELERVLLTDPGFKDAYFNLALLLEKQNLGAQAYPLWKKYLQLDPTGPWADKVRSLLENHHLRGQVIPLRPGCR